MLKRLWIYLQEMYPVLDRLVASVVLFAGIYIGGVYVTGQQLLPMGAEEIIGALTVFGMLLALRIADELKDYKTDMINFPNRALPSGRVKKIDLVALVTVVVTAMIVANIWYMPMPTPLFFTVMIIYASLMSVWFFVRRLLQPNLIATLITHNPIQLLLVFYVLSIMGTQYDVSVFSGPLIALGFIFYIPALVWELSRKIRSPKEEDQYVTYSQIFGRSRAIWIVMSIFLIQLLAISYVYRTDWWASIVIALSFIIYTVISLYNIRHPESYNYGKIARGYLYVTQIALVAVAIIGVL